MTLLRDAGRSRVLVFDIENRPLSYWVTDRPTAEITAIASMWAGDHDSLEVLLLAPPCYHCGSATCRFRPKGAMPEPQMLARFRERYMEADIVTGHYIRRHDLPIINGALYDWDLPLLPAKMSHDTKLDMFKKADIPASQEHLLEVLQPKCDLGVPLLKYTMTQRKWREANRLTLAGIEETRKRVASDVHAHMHLRAAMLGRGWLRPPSLWDPGGGASEVAEGRHR